MNYLKSMGKILTFNTAHLEKGNDQRFLQYHCIINVLVLGLIYGCSAALFSNNLLIEKGLDPSSFNAVKIIVAGIPVAFFMHAGAALFVWVFLRAIGGKGNFLISYFYLGTASVSLWGLAPFLAALQTGNPAHAIKALTAIFALYGLAVNIFVVKAAFQLSAIKMAIATFVTMTYISCFLYLWI